MNNHFGKGLMAGLKATHAATLFFPMALILYDFAAYLSTDLIQPGIINVVRDFNADVSLAPAAVSLYLAGGMALQWLLGPLSDRIGRRPVLITGALIFTSCLRCDNVHNVYDTVSYRACNSGHQYLFYCHRWLCHGAGGVRPDKGIRLMAIITSIVLIAPIIGPLSGAALMHSLYTGKSFLPSLRLWVLSHLLAYCWRCQRR